METRGDAARSVRRKTYRLKMVSSPQTALGEDTIGIYRLRQSNQFGRVHGMEITFLQLSLNRP
jgi:hypothetical protein